MTANPTLDRLNAFPTHVVVSLDGLHSPAGNPAPYGLVTPGERGFSPIYSPLPIDEIDAIVVRKYATRAPSPAEREAALVGSMFGWDVPGADPAQYADNGRFGR
jgi:hypothetical protein